MRQVIGTLRQAALERLLAPRWRGRRPILEVVIALTCLEKAGRFKEFDALIPVLNGKQGLQGVILYLCVEGWRIPWSFRVWCTLPQSVRRFLSDREEAVFLSWVWLKRAGPRVQRFVISTQKMTGRAIACCGKRRWRIEGFF